MGTHALDLEEGGAVFGLLVPAVQHQLVDLVRCERRPVQAVAFNHLVNHLHVAVAEWVSGVRTHAHRHIHADTHTCTHILCFLDFPAFFPFFFPHMFSFFTFIHIHTHTHIHTHIHTHTHTHIYTHTYTHSHIKHPHTHIHPQTDLSSGYGTCPKVQSSHIRMPNDHTSLLVEKRAY